MTCVDDPAYGDAMNIQDRLAEAMIEGHIIDCTRCHVEPAVVQLDISGAAGNVIGQDLLCRACHTDYNWFVSTPPPVPDTSSDIVSGEGGSDG